MAAAKYLLFAFLLIAFGILEVASQQSAPTFSSIYGNFSIALPPRPSLTRGVRNLEAPDKGVGMIYAWNNPDVVYTVLYLDPIEPASGAFSAADKEKALEENNRGVRETVRRYEGQIVSEKPIVIGSLEGTEIRATIGSGELIARNFIVGRRSYSVQAVFGEKEKSSEAMAAISSFKIIDGRAFIQTALNRLTPPPFTEKPREKRLMNDLQLAGLKGRVESVVVEIEDLTGEEGQQGRILASASAYDDKGFQITETETLPSGLPGRVIRFGYYRGRKAARIGQFGASVSDKVDYYIAQKFDAAGRIVETKYTDPQGRIKTVTRYSYGGNWTEAVMTGEKGEMLAKKREVLDERGNAVESILQNSEKGPQDRTFLIYESFDEFGNWTKRTEFEEITENGKTKRVPVMTTFRTFTYFRK